MPDWSDVVVVRFAKKTSYEWGPSIAVIESAKTAEEVRDYLEIHENGRTKAVKDKLTEALDKI